MSPPDIRLEAVRASYRGVAVFDGLSCTLPAAMTTAVIGPGGSGKSTLLTILGRSIHGAPPGLRVEGFVALTVGSSSLLPQRLGALEPARLAETLREAGGELGDCVERCWGSFEPGIAARLRGFMEEPPTELDAETRRLAELTIAVARGQQLLLLDEPLNALGEGAQQAVRRLLLRIRGTRTIVIVTHNLEFTRAVADEVVFLLDGELVEQGSAAKMFENPARERTRSMIRWGA